MRIVILYHPNSEQRGLAEDYAHDYHTRYPGQNLELVSLETSDGARLAELYDVVRYPAILVIAADGGLQILWQDQPWPLFDELAAYAMQ